MLLSKSDFMKFLDCSCHLWLHKFHRDWLPEMTAADEARFESGHEVDELARQLFPGGIEVPDFGQEGWKNTQRAIAEGQRILFQPTIVAGKLTCRADVIVYHEKEKAWDIYEVKSTAKVKERHFLDLAFQRTCFEKAGLKVHRTFIVHINRRYVRHSPIDVKKLLVISDVSEGVSDRTPDVLKYVPAALAVLLWDSKPGAVQVNACVGPHKCDYIECYVDKIPASARPALLRAITKRRLIALLEHDLMEIGQVPAKTLATLGKIDLPNPDLPAEIRIAKDAIRKKLDSLKYPLYFLDYETVSGAIPPFEGYHPFEQIPFQYSLHVQQVPGGKPEHFEFLPSNAEDPVPELAAHLAKQIGPKGTVVAWYAAFEAGCNDVIGEHCPKYAPFFRAVNRRLFDPIYFFHRTRGHYYHSHFQGSASLKKVLPVLVPELAYDDLAIKEGMTASNSWYLLTGRVLKAAEKKKLRKDMIAYCARDTEAMVAIFNLLDEVSSNQDRML